MGTNPIKPAQPARCRTDAERMQRAAYLNDIAARNAVLAANENERAARIQAAAVDRQTAALEGLSRQMERLNRQTDVRQLPVADRALATASRLITEGRLDLSQAQFAAEVGCDVRSLRRGRASKAWRTYREATKREPPHETSRGGRARRLRKPPSDD